MQLLRKGAAGQRPEEMQETLLTPVQVGPLRCAALCPAVHAVICACCAAVLRLAGFNVLCCTVPCARHQGLQ